MKENEVDNQEGHLIIEEKEYMRVYEINLIFRHDVGDQELEDVCNKCKDIITNRDGVIISDNRWGSVHLAKPMKKNKKVKIVHIIAQCGSSAPNEIRKYTKLSGEVVMRTKIFLSDLKSIPQDGLPFIPKAK